MKLKKGGSCLLILNGPTKPLLGHKK
jgi:hypothetical protein